MRRLVARAYGPMQGRSVTARLWIEEVDPAFVVLRKQVTHWVQAVWDDLLPMDVMQDAWKLAFKEVAMSARPHAAATGGGGDLLVGVEEVRMDGAVDRNSAQGRRNSSLLWKR